VQVHRLAVDVHPGAGQRRHPPRHLLPRRVAAVEVVVARRHEDDRLVGQCPQRRRHGDRLHVERDRRADVEQVAGDRDRVHALRRGEQPVELA
jgi:hypothetical protein